MSFLSRTPLVAASRTRIFGALNRKPNMLLSKQATFQAADATIMTHEVASSKARFVGGLTFGALGFVWVCKSMLEVGLEWNKKPLDWDA